MRSSEAESLYKFYRGAERAGRLMRISAQRALPEGLTLAQFELLDLLRQHDHAGGGDYFGEVPEPLTPMAAADRLGLTRGSLTSLLNQLTAKRLVQSVADDTDRRSKRIRLTAEGRAAHRHAMAALSAFTSAAITVFSRERFAGVQGLLDEFIAWLETEGRLG